MTTDTAFRRVSLTTCLDGSLQLGGDKIDKTRNMGIGLMVCKTIAVAHGGKIWAQNLPDGGAEFTFSLQLGEEKNEY